MERKVTKKKLTALLTVFVIIANLFAPYSVLAARDPGEPYIKATLHSIMDLEGDDEWWEDTYTLNYYYDYFNGSTISGAPYPDIDDYKESKVHLVTIDFTLENLQKDVNAFSLGLKLDTSVLIPAYEGEVSVMDGKKPVKLSKILTDVDSDLEGKKKFVEFGAWDLKASKNYNLIDTIDLNLAINGKWATASDGSYSIATMTFLLADGITINDIKPSAFELVATSGNPTGLKIKTTTDRVHYSDVQGADYLVFEGFAADDRVKVKSITEKHGLNDITYYETQPIDFDGMELEIEYTDGSKKTVNSETMNKLIDDGIISMNNKDKFANEDKTITITAGSESWTCNYLLPKKLEVKTDPTKMDYVHGDPLDFTGGEVTITYDDDTTKETIPLTDSSLKPNITVADVDNDVVDFGYIDNKHSALLQVNVTDPVVGIKISKTPAETELEFNENDTITANTGKIITVLKSGKSGTTEIPMNDPKVQISPTKALLDYCTNKRDNGKGTNTQAGDLKISITYTDLVYGQFKGYTNKDGDYVPAEYTVLVNDTISKVEVTKQPTQVNKYGTAENDLDLSGAEATITTASGTTFKQAIDKGMVDFTGYSATSLAEQQFTVKYGNIPTDTGKGLKLTLTNYIKGIKVNPPTTTPEIVYDTNLADSHLGGATYTPILADGSLAKDGSGNVIKTPITAGMITNYVKNPKVPPAVADSQHKFTETLNVKVNIPEYDDGPSKDFNDGTTLQIKVIDTVSGIKVSQNLYKSLWDYGATFDSQGLKIARTYSSGDSETEGIVVKNNTNAKVTEMDDTDVKLTPDPAVVQFDETSGRAEHMLKIAYTDPNTGNTLYTTTKVWVQDILESVAINAANKPDDDFYHGEPFGYGSGKLDITYKSTRTKTIDLDTAGIMATFSDDSAISTEPSNAEYAAGTEDGTKVTKTVRITYTEGAVTKTATYDINIKNYKDSISIKNGPITDYVLNSTVFDFTNTNGKNQKADVEITWLNGKTETVNLDESIFNLTPSISDLMGTKGDNKQVTVTLTDGAGNALKNRADEPITTTFTINVSDGIKNSNITGTDINKKAYNVGDSIDLTGLKFYEIYGSTPTTGEGSEGTEITYPNGKIKVEDITSGTATAFTTNLPLNEFTNNVATRTIRVTFTPDSTKPTLTKTLDISGITVYNQVTSVTAHGTWPSSYDIDDGMGALELEVTRAVNNGVPDIESVTDGMISGKGPGDTTDAIGFSSAKPGSHTRKVTYVDTPSNKADKTFEIPFNYSVNDARTSVTIDGEVTAANKAYNWGEAVNLSELTIYEKFASDTNASSKGTPVSLTDSRVTIKDITNVTSPVDIKQDLTKATKLLPDAFNSANLATRMIEIKFIADPAGGVGPNNVATKTVTINVLNNLDHIEIANSGADKPKNSFSVNETVPNPNGSIFIFRKAEVAKDGASAVSSETKPITSAMTSGLTTATKTDTGSPRTATVTYKENDAHGAEISKQDTYTYTVTNTPAGAEFEGTFTKNKYDWGEALNLSEIKLYQKYADGTRSEVSLSDATTIDVTNESATTPETFTATTSLDTKYFDTSHWAHRKLRISYVAGDGQTYYKEIEIDVYDTVEKIMISDDPKKTYAIGEDIANAGGEFKIKRKSGLISTAAAIPEAMWNGTLDTSAAVTNATATATYKENDAHGIEQSYPATFTYTVADVVTKIEIKTPAPKPQVKYGEALKDSDLTGVFIKVYKGDTDNPVGDPVQVKASMIKGLDINKVGDQEVTVEYGQDLEGNTVTTTMTIEVVDYVKDIILIQPDNTSYEVGETLDLTGAKVQKVMASEEGKTLTTPILPLKDEVDAERATLTGEQTFTSTGTKNIDVKWEEITKQITVTVKDESRTITLTPPTVANIFDYGNPDNKSLNLTGGNIKITNKAGAVVQTINLTDSRVQIGTPDYEDLTPGQTVDVKLDGVVIGQIPVTIQDYVMDIILTPPTDRNYEVGDTALKLQGAKLQIVKASEAGKTLTTPEVLLADAVAAGDATLGTYDLTAKGTQSVSVTWEGKTKSFGITVADSIQKITIESYPKIIYKYGDPIQVTDDYGTQATIKVKRSSGESIEDITLSMLTGYNPNQLGAQTITINYPGYTGDPVQFGVEVKDYITGIEIKKPTKLTYELDEPLNLSGGTVKYVYAGGTLTPEIPMTDSTVNVTGGSTVAEGTIKVTVEYGGYDKDFYITVKDGIGDITITPPTKVDYLYGDSLNLAGGKITITSKSGSEETVLLTDSRVTISNYSKTTLGEQTVDVLLDGDKVGEFTVTVDNYIKEFKVIAPAKTNYEWGEELDLYGGKVQIIMADGSVDEEANLSGDMVDGYDKTKEGSQKITVQYKGYTGTFNVTVVDEIKSIRIKTLPDKTEYDYGEDIDVTGATIEVTKSSGVTVIPVTRDMIKDYNPNKSGSQIVTVEYKGAKDTFIVVVGPAPVVPDTPTGPVQPVQTQQPTKPQVITQVVYVEKEVPKEETQMQEPEVQKPVEQKPVETPKEEEKPTEVLGVRDEVKDPNIKVKAGITSMLRIIHAITTITCKT
ncbi:MAG: bacterial Ig-like domain-containing protein [Clostridia bacterium]|nr:bacterial Ig-like domain-containing protein [Clostridia bacterium]